jgi:hypothetical protein
MNGDKSRILFFVPLFIAVIAGWLFILPRIVSADPSGWLTVPATRAQAFTGTRTR